MTVTVLLPGALRADAGGQRRLHLDLDRGGGSTVADLLDTVAASYPALERRIRDETGQLRRYVNVFVDDDEVRGLQGVDTPIRDGATVHVLPSVAGG